MRCKTAADKEKMKDLGMIEINLLLVNLRLTSTYDANKPGLLHTHTGKAQCLDQIL
jgi:hypothetical protein